MSLRVLYQFLFDWLIWLGGAELLPGDVVVDVLINGLYLFLSSLERTLLLGEMSVWTVPVGFAAW